MSEKVLGFGLKNADYGKICKTCREGIEIDELPEDGMCPECGCGEGFEDVFVIEKSKLVSVRLASESVDLKEHKIVLEENRVLKQALKYICSQNNITYDKFWKRIKPDKWRDYIAKIIKTE